MSEDTTNEQNQLSIKLIGKKGMFLRDMVKAKVLVPPGFIIATAYDRFMKETRLYAKIEAAVEVLKPSLSNMDSVLETSSAIIKLINDAKFSSELEKSILSELAKLKTDYVAIRHSIIIEGELDIFLKKEFIIQLNVGKDGLTAAIKKAWASFYAPAALVYRLKMKMDIKKPMSMLLIQKMISAEVSGVCYTLHPVVRVKTQIFIEANLGLSGGARVQSFAKDTYVVNKKDGKILGKTLLPQKTMLVQTDSGMQEIEVGAVDARNPKLSDKQIMVLAKLAGKIEDFYGGAPQRIEWALEKDALYVFEAEGIKSKV